MFRLPEVESKEEIYYPAISTISGWWGNRKPICLNRNYIKKEIGSHIMVSVLVIFGLKCTYLRSANFRQTSRDLSEPLSLK